MAVNDHGNDYSDCISSRVFGRCPKTVFAALAVSLLQRLEVDFDQAESAILEEWGALHANGIVPQKPPRIESEG